MKHNVKITIILLSMFLITQFIGLFVVNFYFGINLPYGFGESGADIEATSGFISIIIAFIIAIALVMLLTKFKAKFVMKLWFFVVVMIALGLSFTAILWTISPGYKLIPFAALLFALPLALSKIYNRNFLSHNLSELLIYPGIAAIFVPILNVLYLIIFLVLISLYDAWAVWKSGIMQKMAKYQIDHLKIFSGFFVPYLTKKQKQQIEENVKAVSEMDHRKLCLFVQELFLVKENMDKVVFEYTLRACDIQAANHRDVTSLSPMVVMSEISEIS